MGFFKINSVIFLETLKHLLAPATAANHWS